MNHVESVKQIIEMFQASNLETLTLEVDDIKLSMNKATASAASGMDPAQLIVKSTESVAEAEGNEEKADNFEEGGTWVKAPFVGVFYTGGKEDGPPFVEVGSQVKEGDTLCILEAMKIMNEIKAPKSGTVKSIAVDNGQLVEFGQHLISID